MHPAQVITDAIKGQYSDPLILTSPLISGQRVRDAQWLLAGHNVFQSEKYPVITLTGRIDGKYGPVSAGATKESKVELGYPDDAVDLVFGQVLYEYLTGTQKLPADYLSRRASRVMVTTKTKCLNIALAESGNKESPFGSNRTKYGEWYEFNGVPWCAIFVSWCINNALGTLQHPRWKYSYVPSIIDAAYSGRDFLSITHAPQPGDLVSYTLHGEPNAHVEFYKRDLGGGRFEAIGGNTGPISFSNGGEVAQSIRYDYQVTHYVRLSLP